MYEVSEKALKMDEKLAQVNARIEGLVNKKLVGEEKEVLKRQLEDLEGELVEIRQSQMK